MPRPGDTVTYTIGRRTAGGIPVAGLVAADWIVGMFLDGAVAAVTPSWSEIGRNGTWQEYACGIVLPATKGRVKLTWQPPVGTFDQVSPSGDQFALQDFDLDAIGALIASPIVSVVNAGGPQGDIALRVVKDTYAPIAFTVRDQSGAALNLSGYTDPQFGIYNKAQDSTHYLQDDAITMTSGGLVTIAIPEDAEFYAQLLAGVDQLTLYWTFVADEGGDEDKTRCLARGPISVVRTEITEVEEPGP